MQAGTLALQSVVESLFFIFQAKKGMNRFIHPSDFIPHPFFDLYRKM
jgi:hypothetical protein